MIKAIAAVGGFGVALALMAAAYHAQPRNAVKGTDAQIHGSGGGPAVACGAASGQAATGSHCTYQAAADQAQAQQDCCRKSAGAVAHGSETGVTPAQRASTGEAADGCCKKGTK